jgi:hypothetical protein
VPWLHCPPLTLQLHARSSAGLCEGSGNPDLHQVTIEELWGLPSQSQPSDVHVPLLRSRP